MKIRLYRGPLDGKVIKDWQGGSTLVLNSVKKMNKDERHRRFMGVGMNPNDSVFDSLVVTSVYHATRFFHPDGSRFYEWDKPKPGSRRLNKFRP